MIAGAADGHSTVKAGLGTVALALVAPAACSDDVSIVQIDPGLGLLHLYEAGGIRQAPGLGLLPVCEVGGIRHALELGL